MPLIKKLRSEDDVRNNADTILGFSDGEANVNQGTGQITTFNQLGYSNHSLKSHKPDGQQLLTKTVVFCIISILFLSSCIF